MDHRTIIAVYLCVCWIREEDTVRGLYERRLRTAICRAAEMTRRRLQRQPQARPRFVYPGRAEPAHRYHR